MVWLGPRAGQACAGFVLVLAGQELRARRAQRPQVRWRTVCPRVLKVRMGRSVPRLSSDVPGDVRAALPPSGRGELARVGAATAVG